MFSDADFRRLLDDAHAHRAEIDQLIVTLERLVASGARGRPATPPPKAPRYLTPTAPPRSSRLPPPPLVPAPGRVTLAAAVEQVIALDGPLQTGEVAARVRARGWIPRTKNAGKNFSRSVGTVLFKLVDAGVLRRVDNAPAGPGGRAVYGLATTSAAATRKLEAATARVNGTPSKTSRRPEREAARVLASTKTTKTKARPTKARRPPQATNAIPLPTMIVGELANSDGLDATDLTARVVGQGWTTSSKDPLAIVRVALAKLSAAKSVVVDTSTKPRRYRLRAQSAPSRGKRLTPSAPSPTEARENATQE